MSESVCPRRVEGSQTSLRRAVRTGSASRLLAAVLAAVGALALTACASDGPSPPAPAAPTSQAPASGAARLVDPGEFAAVIAEPDRVTVNVHVPFEGDLPGTDLSIPFDQITAQAGWLPANRDTGLAIYCRSGPMSATAAETLRDLGYTDVVELRGGMRAWQADGRELVGI